jgi:hypothetical protein
MKNMRNQTRNLDVGSELILKWIVRKWFWSTFNWLRMGGKWWPSVNIMYLTRLMTIRNTIRILNMRCFYCWMLTDAVCCRLWWKSASQGASDWHPVDANHGRLFWRHGWTNNFNHVAVVSLLTHKPPHQSVNINTRCQGEYVGCFSVIHHVGLSPYGIVN